MSALRLTNSSLSYSKLYRTIYVGDPRISATELLFVCVSLSVSAHGIVTFFHPSSRSFDSYVSQVSSCSCCASQLPSLFFVYLPSSSSYRRNRSPFLSSSYRRNRSSAPSTAATYVSVLVMFCIMPLLLQTCRDLPRRARRTVHIKYGRDALAVCVYAVGLSMTRLLSFYLRVRLRYR